MSVHFPRQSERKYQSEQTCRKLWYRLLYQTVVIPTGTLYYPQRHCNWIVQTLPPHGEHHWLLFALWQLELPDLVTGSPLTKISLMSSWTWLSKKKRTNIYARVKTEVMKSRFVSSWNSPEVLRICKFKWKTIEILSHLQLLCRCWETGLKMQLPHHAWHK